ncbi:MAG: hypothetical protein P8078_04175, partial [bacterium]
GKTQFIPQTESFINLLKPKRIIPVHFWTQEYCEKFLQNLENQNSSGKSYHNIRIGGPQYTLFSSEPVKPIQVIKFARAEYADKKI